jgi:hypothetical protein
MPSDPEAPGYPDDFNHPGNPGRRRNNKRSSGRSNVVTVPPAKRVLFAELLNQKGQKELPAVQLNAIDIPLTPQFVNTNRFLNAIKNSLRVNPTSSQVYKPLTGEMSFVWDAEPREDRDFVPVEDKLKLYTTHRNNQPVEVWRLMVRDTKRPKEDNKAKLPAKMFSFDHLFLFIVVDKEEIHPLNFWLSRTKTLLPPHSQIHSLEMLCILSSILPLVFYFTTTLATSLPARTCSVSSTSFSTSSQSSPNHSSTPSPYPTISPSQLCSSNLSFRPVGIFSSWILKLSLVSFLREVSEDCLVWSRDLVNLEIM